MTDEELRAEMEATGHPLSEYVKTLSDRGFRDFCNWMMDVADQVLDTGRYDLPSEGIPQFERHRVK
ncbi:hypothetical protein [Mycolicibacterium chubuense]|nr:hypothetical protein [Mycolicibacterium chubuense]